MLKQSKLFGKHMAIVVNNWQWLLMTNYEPANQANKSICLLVYLRWYILLCKLHNKVILRNIQSPLNKRLHLECKR